MTPTENPGEPDIKQTHSALREALEYSREIVRQSQALIELAQSEGVSAANDNNLEFTV